jgi:hypothetical protein
VSPLGACGFESRPRHLRAFPDALAHRTQPVVTFRVTVNALTWIGVGLIIFGALWAFLIWLADMWRGRAGDELAKPSNAVAEIIKAIAEAFRAAAELVKLHYGAPALVMVVGLVVVVIGQVA